MQVVYHPRSQGFSAACVLTATQAAEKPWERGWLSIRMKVNFRRSGLRSLVALCFITLLAGYALLGFCKVIGFFLAGL
jgi:hypothetical protein